MAFMVCDDDDADVEEVADDEDEEDEEEEDEVEDCLPPLYFDICIIDILSSKFRN